MKGQAHHMISGLSGGYMPNVNWHYDTKTEALAALQAWKDEMADQAWMARELGDKNAPLPQGNVRDGYFSFRGGYEYAEIIPCETPKECAEAEEVW